MLMAIDKIGQSLNAALELRKLTVDLLPQKLPVQNTRMRAHCQAGDRLSRKDVSGKGTCEIEVQPAGRGASAKGPAASGQAGDRTIALVGGYRPRLQASGSRHRRTRPSHSRRR